MSSNIPTPPVNGRYPKRRFWLRVLLIVFGVFFLLFAVLYFYLDEPLPGGQSGAAADSLARAMMRAVNAEAWENTGAIAWTYAGRNRHLWDRRRHFAEVAWEDKVVLVDLNSVTGVAFENGKRLPAAESEPLVQKAWENWCNDSFWLNPVVKLFDPGTRRELVESNSRGATLLITYESGGVTPGDSYQWFVDEHALPVAWRMWVSVLPVGGIEFSWEDWQTLSTGAKIATLHRNGPVALRVENIRAAAALDSLTGGEDPFSPMLSSD